MTQKTRKNEAYSKLLLTDGDETPVDEDTNFVMELPPWIDLKKVKMGQKFFMLNVNAMVRTLWAGLLVVASTPTILKILMFTKQSSTPALAYRRYKANALHTQAWYKYPIEPGTIAWKSLETVRKMHAVVNRRSTNANVGIISQKDMAITQFTFMGFHLLMPDEFGIVGTREQFEAFNHLWRVLGYMMGIEDKYNCCGETLEETRSRLQSIKEDMLRPTMTNLISDFDGYTKIAVEGMWHSDPTLHHETIIFMINRALNVPGYFYYESEVADNEDKKKSVLAGLSYYTQFRIGLEVLVYEHLSAIFVFRWIFNIMRIFLAVLDVYPFLALISYGKKYAYVEIMKAKK